MKNIFESMNKGFEDSLKAVSKRVALKESVEKPVVEFEEMAIPAPFDTYYRILRPEEYDEILGYDYNADEMKAEAEDAYDIEAFQYATLKDGYDTDGEVKVVAICKDGDNTFVGINVGGQMFPVDFTEVEAQIKEVKNPHIQESKKVKEAKKTIREDLDLWDKLVAAYPALAEEPIRESAEEDQLIEGKAKKMDLWDEIYGRMVEDGRSVKAKTGHSMSFNRGAGYNYRFVQPTDRGMRIGAESLEDLKPAAKIVDEYADRGVVYQLERGSRVKDPCPYYINITIPEELICESARKEKK